MIVDHFQILNNASFRGTWYVTLILFKAWDIFLADIYKIQSAYLLVIPRALDQGDWASTSSGKQFITVVPTDAWQKDTDAWQWSPSGVRVRWPSKETFYPSLRCRKHHSHPLKGRVTSSLCIPHLPPCHIQVEKNGKEHTGQEEGQISTPTITRMLNKAPRDNRPHK